MDITEYFAKLLPFTKLYIIGLILISIMTSMNLMNPYTVVVQPPESLMGHLKVFPSLFYHGKFSMNLVMEIFFFGMLAGRLEETRKGANYWNYLWMLFYIFSACNVLEYIISWNSYYILANSFCMALYYIFSKENPQEQIFIMFVFSVKATYFPWAITLINFLSGGSVWSDLLGIGVGHSYYFLTEVCQLKYRKNYLKTPFWWIQLCNWVHYKVQNSNLMGQRVDYNAEAGGQPAPFRPFQGGGRALG